MPPRPSRTAQQKMLPVTGIGSYPPPSWFRQALIAHSHDAIPSDEFAEAVEDAVQAVIRDQEVAGLDLVTDGELGRLRHAPEPVLAMQETLGFIWGLLARMEGVVYESSSNKSGGKSGGRYRIVGPLSAPEGLGTAQEFAFASRIANRPVKCALPGPFSLAMTLADPTDSTALNDTLGELKPILRQELESLAAQGAQDVQLDEPSLGAFVGVNPQRWVAYFNDLVAGLPYRLHLHICFRNLQAVNRAVPRTYRPLIPYLNDLQVHVIHLEYSLNDMRELALLDDIGYDKHVAIGVVDAHQLEVESAQTVAERIRACLKHVDVRRLRLAPDCGLSALPRPVARAKLEALCQGADIVRKELSRGMR